MTSAALACLIALGTAAGTPPRPALGDPAPALELEALDGPRMTAADLRGAVTVVDFFATWCRPCHEGLADLQAAQSKLGGRVRLLIVDVGEQPAAVRRFLARHSLPTGARVVLDPDRAALRGWGADRIPTTFLLGPDGIIRHINRGHGAGYRARVTGWLRGLLARTAPPAPDAGKHTSGDVGKPTTDLSRR